jgi:serpin B
MNHSEASRETINTWVSEQTEGRIEDLIPEGGINEFTRLVLTNAIYFNAAWQNTFNQDNTQPALFYLADGTTVSVPMMQQTANFGYAVSGKYLAVECLMTAMSYP